MLYLRVSIWSLSLVWVTTCRPERVCKLCAMIECNLAVFDSLQGCIWWQGRCSKYVCGNPAAFNLAQACNLMNMYFILSRTQRIIMPNAICSRQISLALSKLAAVSHQSRQSCLRCTRFLMAKCNFCETLPTLSIDMCALVVWFGMFGLLCAVPYCGENTAFSRGCAYKICNEHKRQLQAGIDK